MLTIGVLAPAVPAAAEEAAPQFRALVFSKTNGFRHASIPDGVAAIKELGQEHNFAVEATEDAGFFTEEKLATYDVVIFNNTNSRNGAILNADQRAAFEGYIQAGGGFVGIHSASGTEYDWQWYGKLLGTFFKSHPAIQELEVEVDDPVHPSTKGLPKEWVRTEEPYDFVANPRGDVHVLASYDTTTYDGDTMGPDHPISWCQNFDGGRSWYTGMGHQPSAYSEPNFRQHLLGGIQWAAGAAPGDCGATEERRFEKIQLAGNTDDPLQMDVDETGRVFFVERGGAVKVYDPETRRVTVAAQFDVLVEHTHGMHGIALDPDFAENNWLYLYYSPLDQDVSLVSRFTFDEATGTVDKGSEQVLLEIDSQREVNAHEGGGMDFGPNGNLYIGTGDNSFPCCSGFGPIDERPGHETSDAQRSSGNTNDLRGKILRIHPEDDGSYTIPEGNLFEPGTAKTRPEIYVMGVRQPYRLHVDPETGWLYWGDVGPDARENSETRGPRGYDEFNQAREAGNFGWPYCVGTNHAYRDYNFATGESGPAFDCAGGPVNDSPNNTGRTQLPPAQPAWISYPYVQSEKFPEFGTGGRLAIGGPTYHFDPDLNSEVKFPRYYDDTVLIAEWTRNAIFEVKLDDAGEPAIINRFLPHETFLRPIDMEFGPDGSLYVMEWGSNYGGSGRGDPNDDSGVYKINYVRPGERSPVAEASATPTSGQPPLTVEFSSAGSDDPDGHAITYAWDFDGDGTTDSTQRNPTHTYDQRGDFSARLTVTDPTDRTGVADIPITVGNTAPDVELVEPRHGQVFRFGDRLDYRVTVTDPEDGSTEAGTIDCEAVVTQPALGHNQHGHPLEQYKGCAGRIRAIVDEGHDANDDIYYIVESTYTDRGAEGVSALSGRDVAILQPRLKQAEHYADADGVRLFDTREDDGGRMVGNIGHGDWVAFTPVNLHGITELTFRYASSGTGGTIELRLDSVDGPLVGSVDVEPTGGSYAFDTVTAQVDDPGGTHQLFLVFKNEPGESYLFNVDWMRFDNPVTDPLREAWQQVEALRSAVSEHADALGSEQESYLTSVADRIEQRIDAALHAEPGSSELRRSVNRALLHASQGRDWVERQAESGAMDAAVADALLTPLKRIVVQLSASVSELAGASAALEPAADEVAAGETVRVEVSLRNRGEDALLDAAVALDVPPGWDAELVGDDRKSALRPGETLTGAWDLTPPADAKTETVSLTGTASYRHRGRSRTVLPLKADVTVRPAIEATSLDLGVPVFTGRENTATVEVANRLSESPVEVTTTLDVPSGWSAGSKTVTVAPSSTTAVEVPVTPPDDFPAGGKVEPATVTAQVSAPDRNVVGAPSVRTYPAPHGSDAVLALDSGTGSSPVLKSYARLAPGDAWDADRGYGWVSTQADSRDRSGPDLLGRDFTWSGTSGDPGILRVHVPPGTHQVAVLTGDASFRSSNTVVLVDGEQLAETGEFLEAGEFAWLRFELDGGEQGRTVDLRLVGEGFEGYWRLNAMVMQ